MTFFAITWIWIEYFKCVAPSTNIVPWSWIMYLSQSYIVFPFQNQWLPEIVSVTRQGIILEYIHRCIAWTLEVKTLIGHVWSVWMSLTHESNELSQPFHFGAIHKVLTPQKGHFWTPKPPLCSQICFGFTPTPPLCKRILVTYFQNTMNVKNPRIWSEPIHSTSYFGFICYSFVLISPIRASLFSICFWNYSRQLLFNYRYIHNSFFSKAYIRYFCDHPLPLYTKMTFCWYPVPIP